MSEPRLAPLARGRRRGPAGRSRHHRLVERDLPVHRVSRASTCGSRASGPGAGPVRGAVQRQARGKARDFNWHNVIGVWSCVPALHRRADARCRSRFPWANALVYRAVGEEPPQQGATVADAKAAVVQGGAARTRAVVKAVHGAVALAKATRRRRSTGLNALWSPRRAAGRRAGERSTCAFPRPSARRSSSPSTRATAASRSRDRR